MRGCVKADVHLRPALGHQYALKPYYELDGVRQGAHHDPGLQNVWVGVARCVLMRALTLERCSYMPEAALLELETVCRTAESVLISDARRGVLAGDTGALLALPAVSLQEDVLSVIDFAAMESEEVQVCSAQSSTPVAALSVLPPLRVRCWRIYPKYLSVAW